MSANTLDMALDDVIKKGGAGGGRRGGRAEQKGGRAEQKGNAGGGRKAGRMQERAGRMQERKAKAPAASDPPKPKEEDRKGLLGRLAFVKGVAAAALGMASKAAAAAAKGTATGKLASIHGRTEAAKVAASVPKAARSSGKGRRGGSSVGTGSIENTAAKLSMTLDDICQTEVKGKQRQPRDGSKGGQQKGGQADEGGRLRKRGGRQMRLKLGRDGNNMKRTAGQKSQAMGNGKAKARVTAGAKNDRGDRNKAGGGGRSAGSSWYEPPAWGGKGGRNSSGKGAGSRGADWGPPAWGVPAKRWAPSDDWGMPPAKRARGDAEWTRGGDDLGRRGGGSGAWSRPPADFHDHRGGRDDAWAAWDGPRGRAAPERTGGMLAWDRPEARERYTPAQRAVERAQPAERPTARTSEPAGCRIKVTNVPLDLDRHDIKEAFEDRGRIVRCEVDRGVAMITFERAADAKQAVQTFDRGELNGQTIFVSLD